MSRQRTLLIPAADWALASKRKKILARARSEATELKGTIIVRRVYGARDKTDAPMPGFPRSLRETMATINYQALEFQDG